MNKHDEIKRLLKASQNMLSSSNTIYETNEIRQKYNLILEQGVVPTSGDITKKINVASAIEDDMDSDEENDNSKIVRSSPRIPVRGSACCSCRTCSGQQWCRPHSSAWHQFLLVFFF